jgi:hypothetical protein
LIFAQHECRVKNTAENQHRPCDECDFLVVMKKFSDAEF